MRTNADRNWELIGNMLAAESSGKQPRLFASRRTLFGIPSALDEELANLDKTNSVANDSTPAQKSASSGKKDGNGAPKHVEHPLEPVFDSHSKALILGTMPSPKSRETGFYYNHPQNRFWRVMAALFDEDVPETNEQKRGLVLRHGIALWDVLASCTIEGASDATIAECVPNDLNVILGKAPIQAIFCTGAKATDLYRKFCESNTKMQCFRLPSTSPANASVSLEQLVDAYKAILPFTF